MWELLRNQADSYPNHTLSLTTYQIKLNSELMSDNSLQFKAECFNSNHWMWPQIIKQLAYNRPTSKSNHRIHSLPVEDLVSPVECKNHRRITYGHTDGLRSWAQTLRLYSQASPCISRISHDWLTLTISSRFAGLTNILYADRQGSPYTQPPTWYPRIGSITPPIHLPKCQKRAFQNRSRNFPHQSSSNRSYSGV